jgi:hypothetical protein
MCFSFFGVCCVGSGLCDGLITRSENPYWVCACVWLFVCGLGFSNIRWPGSHLGCNATETKKIIHVRSSIQNIPELCYHLYSCCGAT